MKIGSWYTSSSHTGFPFGQHLQDFPAIADNGLLLFSWILVRITNSPVLAFNAFYLSTYFLNAIGGYVGARWSQVSRVRSIAIATLFAFLPFHFLQGPGHIFLVMYPLIPVMIGWTNREVRRKDSHITAWTIRDFLQPVILGVVVATSGLYYSIFVLIILLWSFIQIWSSSTLQRALRVIVATGTICVVIVFQFVPIVLFQLKNGSNLEIAKRHAFEVEYYSLRLIDLLLPIPQHRIGALASLSAKGASNFIPGESSEFLGLLGSIGVLLLIASIFLSRSRFERFHRLKSESQIFLFLFLFSTVGGIDQILATFGFVQVRVWSRVSIAIGFLALIAVFKWFDEWKPKRRWGREGAVLALMMLCVTSILDTNPSFNGSSYRAISNEWHNDRQVVSQISKTFGPGARVLEVPNTRFPEQGPINGLEDYAQIRGYLHSTSLCWSYGVVTGRDNSRRAIIKTGSAQEFVRVANREAFDVIWVERRAFSDSGAQLVEDFTQLLGPPLFSDRLNHVAIFDASPGNSSKRAECHKEGY